MMTYSAKQGIGPMYSVDYDPETQRVVEIHVDGTLVGLEVVTIPAGEIEAEQAARVEQVVESICETVRRYVEREINAAGMLLVDRLVRRDPPSVRAQAVEQWVNSVYIEAERRKALVYAGLWPDNIDPCDFVAYGKKPFTIAQLMAEA